MDGLRSFKLGGVDVQSLLDKTRSTVHLLFKNDDITFRFGLAVVSIWIAKLVL